MTTSKLATRSIPYVYNGPGGVKYTERGTSVSRMVIHHWAGTSGGLERLGNPNVDVSANYLILSDGTIVSQVPEEYRAWTSGSPAADNPSITVEVQNSTGAPDWKISAKAYDALTRLIADVAERHGFATLSSSNVKGHQDFAPTACPGPYLYPRLGKLAAAAQKLRGKAKPTKPVAKPKPAGKTIKIGEWWNYKTADDAKNMRNPVRVMPAGTYRIVKTVGGVPLLANVKGGSSGWVHPSVLGAKAPATPPRKSNETIANEVILGKWGVDPERSKNLKAAGYDPQVIQSLVNKKLGY